MTALEKLKAMNDALHMLTEGKIDKTAYDQRIQEINNPFMDLVASSQAQDHGDDGVLGRVAKTAARNIMSG